VQVRANKVEAMWMCADVNALSQEASVTLEDLEDTLAFEKVASIIDSVTGDVMPTFHNYHNLETW